MLSFILYLLFSVCGILCVLLELWKLYHEQTTLKTFGRLKSYPIVGAAPYALNLDHESIVGYIADIFKRIPERPFYAWFGTSLVICTDDPEDAKTILNSSHLLKKSYVYDCFQMSNGLLCASVDKWKPHRRALSPTVGIPMINSFLPIFNEVFRDMADHIAKDIGSTFDPYQMMMIGTYTALLRTGFGVDAKYDDPVAEEIHHMVCTYMHHAETRAQRPWLKWDFIYHLTTDYSKFKAARDGICANLATRRKSAIHLWQQNGFNLEQNRTQLNWVQKCELLHSSGEFDDMDVEDELLMLLIGSTDTSASTIYAVLLMLAIHQEYQELCVDELHDIFDGIDDPVFDEHLSKMTYIELVIKEASRLYPINTFMLRESTGPFRLRDATIPTGAQLVINVYQMHRDPKIWGDSAHQFWPERFLPVNHDGVHPYAYLPFSGGPRNCLGFKYSWPSLKISMTYLLRRYKFTTDLKMDEVRYEMNAVSKIVNKDAIRLERRRW